MRAFIAGFALNVCNVCIVMAWGQPCDAPAHVDVLTHRSNNFRTGANLEETCLTWDNVNTIQKLFTLKVEGQVYAQPLVKTNFEILNKRMGMMETRNVVFIATMENWLYAYDADGLNKNADGVPQPYWTIPAACAGQPDCTRIGLPLSVKRIPWDKGANKFGQFNISPVVGITSTPVIDPISATIFLVAKVADPAPTPTCDYAAATRDCPVDNWIFAVDMKNGSILKKARIDLGEPEAVQIDEVCSKSTDSRRMVITKDDAGRIHMQRAALLMTGSFPSLHLYLGFGSHQDAPCPMYHGMMVRFDYDVSQHSFSQYPNTFLVTKRGETDPLFLFFFHHADQLGKGGIWQAGNGPAADAGGNVYVMTGNGTYKKGVEFGSNVLKLSPELDQRPLGWFAPHDVKLLDTDTLDVDFGASGPVLIPIPGGAPGDSSQVYGGGKQGKLYVLSTTPKPDGTLPAIQGFWAARHWSTSVTRIVIGTVKLWVPLSIIPPLFATGYHHIHGAPAYWGDPNEKSPQDTLERSMYVWPERDNLRAFGYRRDAGHDGKFITKPLTKGPKAGIGMPGGFLSISANGIQNGILWASLPLNDDAWVRRVDGAFRAFKINPDGSKLEAAWTSYCTDPGDHFLFGKYAPPTVANGYVYLPTFSNYVSVYGVPRVGARPAPDPNCKVPPLGR